MQVIISDEEADDLEELGPALNDFTDAIAQFGRTVAEHKEQQKAILLAAIATFAEDTSTKLNVFRRTAPYSKEASTVVFSVS